MLGGQAGLGAKSFYNYKEYNVIYFDFPKKWLGKLFKLAGRGLQLGQAKLLVPECCRQGTLGLPNTSIIYKEYYYFIIIVLYKLDTK